MKMLVLNQKIIVSTLIMMLLICGVQGISYGDDAVEFEIQTCEGERGIAGTDITIGGIVTARRDVQNLEIKAYLGNPRHGLGQYQNIGSEFIGSLSAGNTKSFRITRNLPVALFFECFITASWDEETPDDERDPVVTEQPDEDHSGEVCQVGDILSPGESCTYPGTDATFTVLASGEPQLYVNGEPQLEPWISLFGTVFLSSRLSTTSTINGETYHIAIEQDGGSWEITELGDNVSQPEPSDLVVDPPSVSTSRLAPGGDFILSATVSNQGVGRADGTTLRYYRSTDATISSSDMEVGTDSVSSLSANRTGNESIRLTAPTSAGVYYYGACVDSVDNEVDTANNCSDAVQITVNPPPESDLVVNPPSVSKSTLGPGEDFTLSVTVRNQGEARASGTTLRYYRSTDSTISSGDMEVGTDSVSALGTNRTGDESIRLTAPTSAGTYYYGACVDSVDNETDTANNCSDAVQITVERLPTTLVKISGDNQNGVIGETLATPFVVEVQDQDGTPLEGVSVMFAVTDGNGMLGETSTKTDANGLAETTLILGSTPGANTVIVTVGGIEQAVTFYAVGEGIEFDLSVPAGTNLIHVPLKVTAVDGVAQSITSIADLYDALGGANTVNFLITYDSATAAWLSYFSTADRSTPNNRELTDDMGIIAGMKTATSVRLRGEALGTNGSSTIALNAGLNLVGLPLKDSRINRVSDLLALEGISGNVPVIILTDAGDFKSVGRAGDPGDIPTTGGQGFLLTAQRSETITISGQPWTRGAETAPAPSVSLTGIQVKETTPILALRGSVVDKGTGLKVEGLRVIVKNLSTGRTVTAVTTHDKAGYRLAVVDIEAGRAAMIGDVLEISAQSSNPFVGVHPLHYTVTAEDVKHGFVQLPALVAYEIPAETELLANYPNPFNPETWIPYRLAEDAFVSLTIYDLSGRVVRSLDVGHQGAGVYESRERAIYWDGRNDVGEGVASGVYFYSLTAGDSSATRKMLILK